MTPVPAARTAQALQARRQRTEAGLTAVKGVLEEMTKASPPVRRATPL